MVAAAMIARRSLHDELVGLVRGLIVEGELVAGEKIPEQALCERFGVSRTPLREALKVLASEGIVTLHPNRGATVASVTVELVDELFPIMGALEALAGETACAMASAADLARVRKLHDKMVEHYRRSERTAYIRLNQDIHRALFSIAGNAALTQLYEQLMVRTHAVRFIARKSPERWREAIEDHTKMIEALEARDGAALAGILKQHLVHKAAMVREALAAG